MIVGSALFTAVLTTLGALSQKLPERTTVLDWAQQNYAGLFFVDEGLAFAVATYTVAMILLYQQLRHRSPVTSLIAVVTYCIAAVGFINAILALGRLLYPVNSLSTSKREHYFQQVSRLPTSTSPPSPLGWQFLCSALRLVAGRSSH